MNPRGTSTVAALALTVACLAAPARAEDVSSWRFSGYGTLGAMVTDTDAVQYHASLRQSHGATKTPDTGVDSRLGAQLDYRLNATFSAVGQVIASRRDGSEQPRVEWLYGQAQLRDDTALRVGRLVLPVFLFSDTRNVGYAQHWLRAPSEVYVTYPPSSFDGAQLQWRPRVGDVNFTVQASAGQAKAMMYVLGLDIDAHFRKLRSLNVVAEVGNWTYRAGITTNDGRLMAAPVGLLWQAQDRFSGVGVQYDDGVWLAIAEYTLRRQSSGGAFDSNGGYISGGRRFGAWLPYATYSLFEPKGTAYQSTIKGITTALGLRWDVRTNLALKTQYEWVAPQNQAFLPGVDVSTNERFHTLGIAAEFVF